MGSTAVQDLLQNWPSGCQGPFSILCVMFPMHMCMSHEFVRLSKKKGLPRWPPPECRFARGFIAHWLHLAPYWFHGSSSSAAELAICLPGSFVDTLRVSHAYVHAA